MPRREQVSQFQHLATYTAPYSTHLPLFAGGPSFVGSMSKPDRQCLWCKSVVDAEERNCPNCGGPEL